MPELPRAQREALAQNVKAPLVYTNVLVRNWQPWVKLGVHDIVAPMSFHSRVKLDYPVSLGGYRHARDPSEPMCLHLVHVPGEPGHDARTQFRLGRTRLLTMEFAEFERRIRGELDRMLGPGGFSSARDIAAITVNRWSHGYGYVENSLFDRKDYKERAGARPAEGRPRRHRQFRCRRRRLCASCDRPGRARGARAGGVRSGVPACTNVPAAWDASCCGRSPPSSSVRPCATTASAHGLPGEFFVVATSVILVLHTASSPAQSSACAERSWRSQASPC